MCGCSPWRHRCRRSAKYLSCEKATLRRHAARRRERPLLRLGGRGRPADVVEVDGGAQRRRVTVRASRSSSPAAIDLAQDRVDAARAGHVLDVVAARRARPCRCWGSCASARRSAIVNGTPASWAMARMCSTVLVLPPIAMSRIIALSNAVEVAISRGSTAASPADEVPLGHLDDPPRRRPRTAPCGRARWPGSCRCRAGPCRSPRPGSSCCWR